MSLRGLDWLSAVSEKDVSDCRSRWSVQNPITPPRIQFLTTWLFSCSASPALPAASQAGADFVGEGALVEMERVGLRCANPTYRVDVRLLVVENLVQRVGFQYPVGPDVDLLGGGLFQALMHVLRQRAEAIRQQTNQ